MDVVVTFLNVIIINHWRLNVHLRNLLNLSQNKYQKMLTSYVMDQHIKKQKLRIGNAFLEWMVIKEDIWG
jgi:hypothetical protein